MKLQILSDLHNEFEEFNPPENDADLVILAGDINLGDKGIKWIQKKFPADKKILYVLGNHEFYDHLFPELYQSLADKIKETNIKLLEQNTIKIKGTRFIGCSLWTDFAINGNLEDNLQNIKFLLNDYAMISSNDKKHKHVSPQEILDYHLNSINWLKKQLVKYKDEKIVVITHHAPSQKSINPKILDEDLYPAYASNLEEIIKNNDINLWIHGHTHCAQDYKIKNTRIICNPRGYPKQNTGFNPNLIINV